jgi:hypothetical protein
MRIYAARALGLSRYAMRRIEEHSTRREATSVGKVIGRALNRERLLRDGGAPTPGPLPKLIILHQILLSGGAGYEINRAPIMYYVHLQATQAVQYYEVAELRVP